MQPFGGFNLTGTDTKTGGPDYLLQFTNATGFQYLHTDRVQADSTLAGWLNVRVGIECIHLHGIRYHRRT